MRKINDYLSTLNARDRAKVEKELNKQARPGDTYLTLIEKLAPAGLNKYISSYTKSGALRKTPLIDYELYCVATDKYYPLNKTLADLVNWLLTGYAILQEPGTLEKAYNHLKANNFGLVLEHGGARVDLQSKFYPQFNRRVEFLQDMKAGRNLEQHAPALLAFYELKAYEPGQSK